MNIKNFFSYHYQFYVGTMGRSDKLLFSMALMFILLAIVFKFAEVFSPNVIDRKFRAKFFNLFLTIGILELLWFGARYQNVQMFGSHAVVFAILLIWFVWLVFIVKDLIQHYSAERQAWEKEQIKLKYLNN